MLNTISISGYLQVLHSTHYAGAELMLNLGAGESWTKVFGPIFVYLNSLSGGGDFQKLWEDANKQVYLRHEK